MACMLVASYGCRCGTVRGRETDDNNVIDGLQSPMNRAARLDAIKLDILGKLGMTSEPVVRPNRTIEETRNIIRMYRKNLPQLEGAVHNVDENDKRRAKQFNSYGPSQNGMSLSDLLTELILKTG